MINKNNSRTTGVGPVWNKGDSRGRSSNATQKVSGGRALHPKLNAIGQHRQSHNFAISYPAAWGLGTRLQFRNRARHRSIRAPSKDRTETSNPALRVTRHDRQSIPPSSEENHAEIESRDCLRQHFRSVPRSQQHQISRMLSFLIPVWFCSWEIIQLRYMLAGDRYIWKVIYLIAVPWKYICGCIGASMLRNVNAVFDRTNNTPKLGVVNMPFGLV